MNLAPAMGSREVAQAQLLKYGRVPEDCALYKGDPAQYERLQHMLSDGKAVDDPGSDDPWATGQSVGSMQRNSTVLAGINRRRWKDEGTQASGRRALRTRCFSYGSKDQEIIYLGQ